MSIIVYNKYKYFDTLFNFFSIFFLQFRQISGIPVWKSLDSESNGIKVTQTQKSRIVITCYLHRVENTRGTKMWPWNNLNTAYANIQIAMCQGSRDSTMLFTDIHVSKVCYSDIHTLSIVDSIKKSTKRMNPHKVPVARSRSRVGCTGPDQSRPSVTSMSHVCNIAPCTWPPSSSLHLDSHWILRQESVGVPLFFFLSFFSQPPW